MTTPNTIAKTLTITDTETNEVLVTVNVADFATPIEAGTWIRAKSGELVDATGHTMRTERQD